MQLQSAFKENERGMEMILYGSELAAKLQEQMKGQIEQIQAEEAPALPVSYSGGG